MSQRELERYYEKRASKEEDPDPTFEEWCARKGFQLESDWDQVS